MGFKGCTEGANAFIEDHFRDCVYDYWDYTGFVLGLTSIILWISAQIPQFISNIRNQSAEALSIWFLAQWFLGDTLNLLGCLIQGQQLPTTTALAMYFVLSDVVMLLQYLYYRALQKRREAMIRNRKMRRSFHQHHHKQHHHHGSTTTSCTNLPMVEAGGMTLAGDTTVTAVVHNPAASMLNVAVASSMTLMTLGVISAWRRGQHGTATSLHATTGGSRALAWTSSDDRRDDWDWEQALGTAFGYCSTSLYLASRVSQIYKNWQRQSAEGLSVAMFCFTIAANTCTGLSILLRLQDKQQLIAQLPWICGAFGTVGLDATIFTQARKYNRLAAANNQVHVPLLEA